MIAVLPLVRRYILSKWHSGPISTHFLIINAKLYSVVSSYTQPLENIFPLLLEVLLYYTREMQLA